MELDRRTLGAAGELRVMSELMLRGFNPAKVFLDNGVDLILENRKTIQVKTSEGGIYNGRSAKREFQYNFSFQDWKNKQSLKCDFAVCWAVGRNEFLIIPSDLITSSLVIYNPKWSNSKLRQFLNNWEILR